MTKKPAHCARSLGTIQFFDSPIKNSFWLASSTSTLCKCWNCIG